MSKSKWFLFFSFISLADTSFSLLSSGHRCSTEQSVALLLFKESLLSINDTSNVYAPLCQDLLGTHHYPFMMTWNSSTDCCLWDRITCDDFTGDVIDVDLNCGMLQGTIQPNTTLFHLPYLQRLNLAYNDFSSSHLSPDIGRYAHTLTHLNISFSRFTGQIPKEISFLPKLVSLDLSWNWFGFNLEAHVFNNIIRNCTHLKELSLGGVNISLVLPTHLNSSSALKLLNLRHTGLRGELPDNIFSLPLLEELDLSYNSELTGSLPKLNRNNSICLRWLSIAETGLSGQIPDSIIHLNSLSELYLSSTELEGEIPNSIGYLKSLHILDLSHTKISGEIPDSIGHLESLIQLDLSDTKLSGQIPNSIGHLETLSTLQLSKCGFIGAIPTSIGKLRQLTDIYLSENMLNGTLPSWLFTLPLLETIFLDNNLFTGSIPSELFTHQAIKQLKLGNNQLVGKIDVLDQGLMPQSFQGLTNLTYLDLSFNNFIGKWELDTLLSSLSNLETLHLSYSGLSVVTNNAYRYVNPDFFDLRLASCKLCVFPEALQTMKNLNYLDLSENQIIGHIPDWAGEIGNQLQYLNLSHNFMTGSFPQLICNMSNPYMLDISNNGFDGAIPQCFESVISNLVMVDLQNNNFHGSIPNVDEGCQLDELILKGNQLQGQVPSSLAKCLSLKILDLGDNQLNGTFPSRLSDLPVLQVLNLRSNNLHGPVKFSSTTDQLPFPSLQVLDLSHNRFAGSLPHKHFGSFQGTMTNLVKKGTKPEYMKLLDKYYSVTVVVKGLSQTFSKILIGYTIVDLSYNRFENEIPDVIGSFNSLIVLDLSHNHLSSRIPHALGNLSQIESLDLSWNQLTGEIPQSLADLTFLEFLNLSQNHLVGRIPQGTQFSTFNTSFGGNPELCGFPLPMQCRHPSSQLVEVDGVEDNELTWEVVALGYGCGTIIGLVMGYWMLSTGRPKWFNAIADAGERMIQTSGNTIRYVYIGK